MVSEKCFIFLETFPETRHHLEAENEELKASMKILEQRCAELTEINKKKQQDWVQSTNTENLGPTEEENLGQTAMEKNLGQVEEKNLGLTAIEKNLEETAEDSTEDVQVVRLRAEVSALSAEAKVSRLARKTSTSSSVCWTDRVHCSHLPHGGRNTPPLCWNSQCTWPYRPS